MKHWYRTYFPEPNWIKIPLRYKASPIGSRLDMKYVKEIKSTITRAHEFEDHDGVIYKLKILGRGEELFFQKGNAALICEISARYAAIDPKTIHKWDNGNKISDEERALILEKIIELYKKAYKDDLAVFKN